MLPLPALVRLQTDVPDGFPSPLGTVVWPCRLAATSSYTPFHHPHSLRPPLTRLPFACAEFGKRYWLWLRANSEIWTFRLGRVEGSR